MEREKKKCKSCVEIGTMLNGNISRDIHIRSMRNLSYNIKFNYAGLRRLYRCQFFSKSSICLVLRLCHFFRQFFFHSLLARRRRRLLIVIFQAGVNILAPVCRELAAISLLTSARQSMNEASEKKPCHVVESILCCEFPVKLFSAQRRTETVANLC